MSYLGKLIVSIVDGFAVGFKPVRYSQVYLEGFPT